MEEIKLTLTQVLNDLHSGLDRKQIREKYNLTATEATQLFSHPKLKGVKRVKVPTRIFQIIDDTVNQDSTTTNVESSVQDTQEESTSLPTSNDTDSDNIDTELMGTLQAEAEEDSKVEQVDFNDVTKDISKW